MLRRCVAFDLQRPLALLQVMPPQRLMFGLDPPAHSGQRAGLSFFPGRRAPGYEREVNALDCHVALHLRFADRASHDAYQVSSRHEDFIERCSGNWASVRVFDAED